MVTVWSPHTQEHREAVPGGGTPVIPCAANPSAITENDHTYPQRFLCTQTHTQEHKGTATLKNSVRKPKPQPLARAAPGQPLARCDAHHMSPPERLSMSPSRLR